MYKREVTIGQNVLSIETGKLAKQANGSVIVRYGDTVVLVTACYAPRRAQGDRLPAAHRRLPGIHLRVGPHPRRLLQARGQAGREGSADEPVPSTGRSARSSRPAGTTRPRSSRWCSRPTPTTTRTCSRSPARRPRWRCRRSRSRRPSPAVRVALVGRRVRHQPDVRAAQGGAARHRRRRQQGRPRDGRGGREGRHRGAGGRGARGRARGDQADRRHDRPDGAGSRQDQGGGAARRRSAATSTARSRRRSCCRSARRCSIQDKIESYAAVDQILEELVASMPEEEVERRSEAKAIFKELKEKVLRDAILERARAARRPRSSTRSARSGSRSGVLPRTHGSAVFTRGETQALVTATLGTADDQQKVEMVERRDLQALHAPLQLPAVLGRRGGLPARPGPPRGRPRRAGRARRWRR